MVNLISICLVLISSILGALGQIQLKKGMDIYNFQTLFSNYNLFGGIFFYGIATIIYLSALKGDEVSVLYPIVATSYIWTCFLAVYFLGEKMNISNWFGILLILLGVFFVVR
ncbi:MAG: hypothetical protein B6U87_02625 [Candidatus Aenigmarchaeota archaeon ex4484_52]|nr:MAG: hypothetical protein B6U87_02625 [Candidatus Aenigmarchaeota archaeon ex4484_52]